jgi:uncharacterized membrane protein YfcA
LHELGIVLVGFFSGMAGPVGGVNSLVAFPGLLLLGYSPLQANVTNTVGGLVPAAIGASLSYRTHIDGPRRTLYWLAALSVLGGALGGVLLQVLGESVFRSAVPALLIGGSALILLQPIIVKRLRQAGEHKTHLHVVYIGTFVVTIYSGYFGAGAGVLLVSLYALMLSGGMQRANAMKSVMALASNLAAAVFFAFAAPVDWSAAVFLAPSSFLGAVIGVRIAKRMPDEALRIVVAIGGVSAALVALR